MSELLAVIEATITMEDWMVVIEVEPLVLVEIVVMNDAVVSVALVATTAEMLSRSISNSFNPAFTAWGARLEATAVMISRSSINNISFDLAFKVQEARQEAIAALTLSSRVP